MESGWVSPQRGRDHAGDGGIRETVMTSRKHIVLAGFAALTITLFGMFAAGAKPVNYHVPDDELELKPGKNLEVVQDNCTACHSPDYFKTQPQGPAFKASFWQAEEDDQGLRRTD